jgi:tetratricopeptide (TPR) repeat protein
LGRLALDNFFLTIAAKTRLPNMKIGSAYWAALLGALCLTAQNETPRFDDVVRNDIFAGFGGNKEALERGMKKCEEVLAANPKHAEAMVWLGSATAFLGGQAFARGDAAEGIRLSTKGRELMDKAVELQPRSIGVRIPRGASLLGGARYQQTDDRLASEMRMGLDDYLVAFDIQKGWVGKMSTHSKGELFLGIANAYYRLGEKEKAREWFTQIPPQVPGSIYAAKAKKWLDTGSLTPREVACLGCHVKQ